MDSSLDFHTLVNLAELKMNEPEKYKQVRAAMKEVFEDMTESAIEMAKKIQGDL